MSREAYRMVSWWLTWRDLDWPSSDNFDRIRRRADEMAAAEVNAAVIFGCHFRWDFLPCWTMLHDYLATVRRELKARGIALFDHHSGTLVHRYDGRDGLYEVKLHSGPHLPFCPDRTAAADWTFHGSRLNDWRMIDLATGEPAWNEKYAAEEFCFVNPEFRAAYLAYLRRLIADTAIDGLMADDFIYFNGYRTCGCRHCRARFRAHLGYELPAWGDAEFWGNWANPDWSRYLDLRYESNGDMLVAVRSALPSPDFPLMSCCSGSSYAYSNNTAQDIRQFMRSCNLVHLEMCGDIPPWPGDPQTRVVPIGRRLAMARHHRAVAGETGGECIGLGYGFTAATAGIVWALDKFLGSGCWFSMLKGRLGLPERELAALPDEAAVIGPAYRFEAAHPELFAGAPLADVAVFFSYETRNHTFYGNLEDGLPQEFFAALTALTEAGIAADAVCRLPDSPARYRALLLPGAAKLTGEEVAAGRAFLAAGGRIYATGPCGWPGLELDWPMPSRPADFANPLFLLEEHAPPCGGARRWTEPVPGLLWHPGRIGELEAELPALLKTGGEAGPVELLAAPGYYHSFHRDAAGRLTLHLLAARYHTEIDQALEARRGHRSAMHYITAATPVGLDGPVRLRTGLAVTVFAPLSTAAAAVEAADEQIEIALPPACPYAILAFDHNPDQGDRR